MGKILITMLILVPMFAAALWLGLTRGPGFEGKSIYSKLSELARPLRFQGLANHLSRLKRIGAGLVALSVKKCRLAYAAGYSGLSTAIGRFRAGRFVCRLESKESAAAPGFSALTNRFKSLIRAVRSRLAQLAARFGCESIADRIRPALPKTTNLEDSPRAPEQPDPAVLNCRVALHLAQTDGAKADTFAIELYGSIHAPSKKQKATLKVTILDVTDAKQDGRAVHAAAKQWRTKDSPVFCYTSDLGKLSARATLLSDWTSVARLQAGWLLFPRKGSIVSLGDSRELGCAECTLTYDNEDYGYLDLEDNRLRTRTLAVALAFAVSAVDGKMFNSEIHVIKSWARDNFRLSEVSDRSDRARRKLEKALDKTLAFFREGNQLDIHGLCREVVEISCLPDRYEIMEFFMQVTRAKGSVVPEELAILGDLAEWLEVEHEVFRTMMGRILPVAMHEVKDTELVLGVTPDMDKEKARRHLNEEYSKWNARVTNSDPEIQAQADQMLSLIAEARRQYVG